MAKCTARKKPALMTDFQSDRESSAISPGHFHAAKGARIAPVEMAAMPTARARMGETKGKGETGSSTSILLFLQTFQSSRGFANVVALWFSTPIFNGLL